MILKRGFGIIGVLLLVLAIFLPGYTKMQELKERNRDLETKNRSLLNENDLLAREIERIKLDSDYQEKILREKMGVVRKDEIPLKIVPADKQ